MNDSKDVSNPDETGTTAVVNDKTDLKSEDMISEKKYKSFEKKRKILNKNE